MEWTNVTLCNFPSVTVTMLLKILKCHENKIIDATSISPSLEVITVCALNTIETLPSTRFLSFSLMKGEHSTRQQRFTLHSVQYISSLQIWFINSCRFQLVCRCQFLQGLVFHCACTVPLETIATSGHRKTAIKEACKGCGKDAAWTRGNLAMTVSKMRSILAAS